MFTWWRERAEVSVGYKKYDFVNKILNSENDFYKNGACARSLALYYFEINTVAKPLTDFGDLSGRQQLRLNSVAFHPWNVGLT